MKFSLSVLLILSCAVFCLAHDSAGEVYRNERGSIEEQIIQFPALDTLSPEKIPVPEYYLGADREESGNRPLRTNGDNCYTQKWGGPIAYYWPLPQTWTNIPDIAVRFTGCGADTLKKIHFYLYDFTGSPSQGDGVFGNDTVFVTVYEDSCCDVGPVLYSTMLLPGEYDDMVYPDSVTIEVTPALVVHNNFYVGLSSSAVHGTGDYEACLQDGGDDPHRRSYVYQVAVNEWIAVADMFGQDYNFLIWTDLCRECEPPYAGSGSSYDCPPPEPPCIGCGSAPQNENGNKDDDDDTQLWRVLKLKRFYFRETGDWPGRMGEVYCRYLVHPTYFGGGCYSGVVPKGEPLDVKQSKKNCEQNACDPGEDDDCRWVYYDKDLMADQPLNNECFLDPVSLNLRFYDVDWNYGKWVAILILVVLTVVLGILVAASGYGLLVQILLFAGLGAGTGFITIPEMIAQYESPKWSYEKDIGEYDDDICLSKADIPLLGGAPVSKCVRCPLDNIWDKRAEAELEWLLYATGSKKGYTDGDPWGGKEDPKRDIPAMEDLRYASCGNITESEFLLNVYMKLDLGMDIPDRVNQSLHDPDSLGVGETRTYVCYFDTDGCLTTGCDEVGTGCCGAEYKVVFEQTRKVCSGAEDTVVTTPSIHKFKETCCPIGTPGYWEEQTDTAPYDMILSHELFQAKIRTQDLEDPEYFAFWAVSFKNGVLSDRLPEDACGPRSVFIPQAVAICPYVSYVEYASVLSGARDSSIIVGFSEMMAPIDPTDVSVSPMVPISIEFDETAHRLHIIPATADGKWYPGKYEFTLHGTITDAAGNALDGDPDTPGCGEPYVFNICINDTNTFYVTDIPGGDREGLYDEGEDIYACGCEFQPNVTFDMYLILHQDLQYGLKLYDLSSTGPTPVTTSGTGSFESVNVGTPVVSWGTEMNLVADLNRDNYFDSLDRALNPCEIAILAGEPCLGGPDCIIGAWTFNDPGESDRVIDLVDGRHGTKAANGPTPVAGMVGGAMYFDGVDDYVEIADDGELDFDEGDDFSIEFWYKADSYSGVNTIYDNRFVEDYAQGITVLTYNDMLCFQMADGGGSTICSNDPNTSSCTNYGTTIVVNDGDWHHVAIVVDRDEIGTFYVDGDPLETFAATIRDGSMMNNCNGMFGRRVMTTPGYSRFTLDEFAIYDEVLTPEAVAAIYAAGSGGKCCQDPGDPGCDVLLSGDCCGGECDCSPGDANDNEIINILDITYLINYLYKTGPAPQPYTVCSGDCNCDCIVNILDVTYLINYMYKGGAAPCPCEEWITACGP